MKEYKSFYKTVAGSEGEKCCYPTRLDTYGCGCQHDCKYCYAKSLLEFRNLWDSSAPSVADIKKIEQKIKTLSPGTIVRLGGMTDCFQPCEKTYRTTYKTIQLLNKYKIHYLIVTKSDMVADDEYISILDKDLAHIQITVTSTSDQTAASYEKATPPSKRMHAIEKLESLGFDVQIRLSPFIPEYIDLSVIEKLKCKRAIVEFLRVNSFIKQTFQLDYTPYTVKEGNYYHLPLQLKQEWVSKISKIKEVSICEDHTQAYNYWKEFVNPFPDDCCNLRFRHKKTSIGNTALLYLPKFAYLCSQTSAPNVRANTLKWLKSLDLDNTCIISGFHSPTERFVLDLLLKSKAKIIMVLAKQMFKNCPPKYAKAIEEGRMLIISPFSNNTNIVTKESAVKRNQYVINHSNTVILGHIRESGMLEKLINDSKTPHYKL